MLSHKPVQTDLGVTVFTLYVSKFRGGYRKDNLSYLTDNCQSRKLC